MLNSNASDRKFSLISPVLSPFLGNKGKIEKGSEEVSEKSILNIETVPEDKLQES